jgi:hypothetical protein
MQDNGLITKPLLCQLSYGGEAIELLTVQRLA